MSVAKYRKLFNISVQNTVVYRWNFLLRGLFEVVPLLGTVYLWRALYASRGQPIAGYDFGAMVFYFLLTLAVSNLITPADDDWQIAADIRDGQLNALLTKPVNYLWYRISIFLGNRATHTAVTLPFVVLIFLSFHRFIRWPLHAETWVWTLLSVTLAAFLQFFITYGIALLAFWFLEISTIIFIVLSFEYFLSGHLFPLDLTPGWFQAVATWLPFTYELFFPVSIFLEKTRGAALYQGLLIQAAWVAVAWWVGRAMWSRGLRRYGAYGG